MSLSPWIMNASLSGVVMPGVMVSVRKSPTFCCWGGAVVGAGRKKVEIDVGILARKYHKFVSMNSPRSQVSNSSISQLRSMTRMWKKSSSRGEASRCAICRPAVVMENTSECLHAQNQLARGGVSRSKKSSEGREASTAISPYRQSRRWRGWVLGWSLPSEMAVDVEERKAEEVTGPKMRCWVL